MAMTYKFGGGFGKIGWLVRFRFGEYFCCGVFATIFGIGFWHRLWNCNTLKRVFQIYCVEKSIARFSQMEEVVEKYLENEKIVGDRVLLILCSHVFMKYWVVVTTPIHLCLETVTALQFSEAYY